MLENYENEGPLSANSGHSRMVSLGQDWPLTSIPDLRDWLHSIAQRTFGSFAELVEGTPVQEFAARKNSVCSRDILDVFKWVL